MGLRDLWLPLFAGLLLGGLAIGALDRTGLWHGLARRRSFKLATGQSSMRPPVSRCVAELIRTFFLFWVALLQHMFDVKYFGVK
jgi:hypothetical protein